MVGVEGVFLVEDLKLLCGRSLREVCVDNVRGSVVLREKEEEEASWGERWSGFLYVPGSGGLTKMRN